MEQQYPGIRDRLLDDKGVRRFINLYLNEDDVRFLDSLKTAVKNKRVVILLGPGLTVPGPRVIDGIEKMSRALHP